MRARERVRAADLRFWVPALVSALAVIALVATIIDPQWIEAVSGASPDDGSGDSEWAITVAVAAVAVACLGVTGWRWHAIGATPGPTSS